MDQPINEGASAASQLADEVVHVAQQLATLLTKIEAAGFTQSWVSIGAQDIAKGLAMLDSGIRGYLADCTPAAQPAEEWRP